MSDLRFWLRIYYWPVHDGITESCDSPLDGVTAGDMVEDCGAWD